MVLTFRYFTLYVIIAAAFSPFFYLSQVFNVLAFSFYQKVVMEEALSARKLEAIRTYSKRFQTEELVPLFVFVFMVGLLYGMLSPLTLVFVSLFFLVCYKGYRFMVCTSVNCF